MNNAVITVIKLLKMWFEAWREIGSDVFYKASNNTSTNYG